MVNEMFNGRTVNETPGKPVIAAQI